MAIQPLNDHVLLRPVEAVEQTPGGLYLPDTAREKPSEGVVVAVPAGGADGLALGDLAGTMSGSNLEISGNRTGDPETDQGIVAMRQGQQGPHHRGQAPGREHQLQDAWVVPVLRVRVVEQRFPDPVNDQGDNRALLQRRQQRSDALPLCSTGGHDSLPVPVMS